MEDKEMRARVPREWVWVPILLAVLMLALFGCGVGDISNELTKDEAEVEKIKGTVSIYKMTFENHDYIVFNNVGLIHSASCKGRH